MIQKIKYKKVHFEVSFPIQSPNHLVLPTESLVFYMPCQRYYICMFFSFSPYFSTNGNTTYNINLILYFAFYT